MSSGVHTNRFDEASETYHTTCYDNEGRHSFDWNPTTGDITKDHSVSNENPDKKEQWSDSNIWKDLEKDSEQSQN